jgi:fatty-acyl-CoA synthase
VVCVANAKYGDEVAAFIQLKPKQQASPQKIPSYCREQISYYKISKHIFFIDDYPTTASGKIQKYKLREMALAKLQ